MSRDFVDKVESPSESKRALQKKRSEGGQSGRCRRWRERECEGEEAIACGGRVKERGKGGWEARKGGIREREEAISLIYCYITSLKKTCNFFKQL